MTQEKISQIADLFDAVAPTYDQVGVEFFGPIAEHLTGVIAPVAGESIIEMGCGRGALTLPLAAAVGPTGRVAACDVSPAMVSATANATSGLTQVSVELMNAAEPTYEAGSCDIVASSAVIFFLPEPSKALRRWVDLLVPGGRIGLTTFGRQDDIWLAVDRLFDPYLPPTMLDARTSGKRGPFVSDASFEALMLDSGVSTVTTSTQHVNLRFGDVADWQRWTMSVGQRTMWGFVPATETQRLLDQAAELLETARDADGMITLSQDVRHTLGLAPG